MEKNRNLTALKYPLAVAYVLPFVVYSVVMSFYPKFDESYENNQNEMVAQAATSETWWYLGLLGLQILLASCLIVYFRKVYSGSVSLQNFAMVVRGWCSRCRIVGGFS